MKRTFLSLLALLLIAVSLNAQQLQLDENGKVSGVKLKSSGADFDLAIKSKFSPESMQEAARVFFLNKVSGAVANLEDTRYFFHDYYEYLWGSDELGRVTDELKALKTWLGKPEPATAPTGLVHLKPFYEELKIIMPPNKPDWYQLNGQSVSNKLPLSATDLNADADAYIINLVSGKLFNQLTVTLFNKTYPQADNDLHNFTSADFNGSATTDLQNLINKARALSGKSPNTITAGDITGIRQLNADINANRIIASISGAEYFKTWIWLRQGEPTINPFEQKARDKANKGYNTDLLPRTQNRSILTETATAGEYLNRILFSKAGEDGARNIHHYRISGKSDRDFAGIKDPVRGDENVRINMHNTEAGEALVLRKLTTTPHEGLNNSLEALGDALGDWAEAYKNMTPATANWLIRTATLFIPTEKSDFKMANYPKSNSLTNNVKGKDTVLLVIKNELAEKHMLNPHLFADITTSDDLKDLGKEPLSNTRAFVQAFLELYEGQYNMNAALIKNLSKDSMVATITHMIVYESNLPPSPVQLQPPATTPTYRTEVLETGVVDADVTTTYEVKKLFMKNDVQDSAVITGLSIKSGKLKRFTISAGLAFTIPDKYYAMNTITESENAPLAITTKRKLVSFMVALNIHFCPIYTLDDHWFCSRQCPWYTRLSLHLGLDVPDVTDHFYPGISYDLIPGFKLTGGVHLYRHTRYELKNNRIEDQMTVLRGAGPFAALSIDPNVILKVINIFK